MFARVLLLVLISCAQVTDLVTPSEVSESSGSLQVLLRWAGPTQGERFFWVALSLAGVCALGEYCIFWDQTWPPVRQGQVNLPTYKGPKQDAWVSAVGKEVSYYRNCRRKNNEDPLETGKRKLRTNGGRWKGSPKAEGEPTRSYSLPSKRPLSCRESRHCAF